MALVVFNWSLPRRLLNNLSIPHDTLLLQGVLIYVKDAYMSPIVMLRGLKNRYCHFFGIIIMSIWLAEFDALS